MHIQGKILSRVGKLYSFREEKKANMSFELGIDLNFFFSLNEVETDNFMIHIYLSRLLSNEGVTIATTTTTNHSAILPFQCEIKTKEGKY